MDLPEVRGLIGRYLSLHDLTSCVRVCKDWRASFIPFIYHTFQCTENFNERYSSDPSHFPSARTLEKYSRHIVALSVTPSAWFLNILMVSCENIKLLGIQLLEEDYSEDWPKIARLVGNNPRLEKVMLKSLTSLQELDSRFLVDLNVRSTQLKYLELHTVILNAEDLDNLRNLCTRGLTHLDLQLCSIRTTKPEELDNYVWPELPSLRFLHLATVTGTTLKRSKQLEWFQRCPNLEHMGWEFFDIDKPPFPYEEFEKFLDAEGSPSRHISSLVLAQGIVTDSEVGRILDRCRRSLVKFHIQDAQPFCLNSFMALSRHFKTLQDLELNTHESFVALTQMVMERCPRLVKISCDMSAKHFYRGVISDDVSTSVVDNCTPGELQLEALRRLQDPAKFPSRPWICKGLRDIVCYMDCSNDMRENRRVFYQLSKMKALHSACFQGLENTAGHYFWFSPDFTEDMEEDALALVDLPSTPPSNWGNLLSRYLADMEHDNSHSASKFALSIWPRLDSISFMSV